MSRQAAGWAALALALSVPAGAWADTRAATMTVSAANAAVALAVFRASSTAAAFERLQTAELRRRKAEIDALGRRVKAGERDKAAALAEQQQAFVAELAEKDRAYEQAIAAFRGSVVANAVERRGPMWAI